MRILLVEPRPTALGPALEAAGHEVRVCPTAAAGLRELRGGGWQALAAARLQVDVPGPLLADLVPRLAWARDVPVRLLEEGEDAAALAAWLDSLPTPR